MNAGPGPYSFSASRCFRSEFRREIFAFAASTCPALDALVRDGRSGNVVSLPSDGIKGWVGWIESRVSGCVRIGPADEGPVLGMPTNALGRDLFEKVARMRACDMRDSGH